VDGVSGRHCSFDQLGVVDPQSVSEWGNADPAGYYDGHVLGRLHPVGVAGQVVATSLVVDVPSWGRASIVRAIRSTVPLRAVLSNRNLSMALLIWAPPKSGARAYRVTTLEGES